MTEGPRAPVEQLDVPLVWDRVPGQASPREVARPPRRAAGEPPRAGWSRLRLWVASLADLGVVLLLLAASWAVAVAAGASLTPPQLVVAGLVGVTAAAVVGAGALWVWRATPGMALLHLRFAAPLTLGHGQRAWLGWLAALLLAGVPLLLGRRGRTGAERLAGSELTLQ